MDEFNNSSIFYHWSTNFDKMGFFGVKIENEKIICDGGNLVQVCFRK